MNMPVFAAVFLAAAVAVAADKKPSAETFILRREGDKCKIAHIHMSASKK